MRLGLLISGILLASCGPDPISETARESALATCQDEIKKVLVAPATFRLVYSDVMLSSRPVTYLQYSSDIERKIVWEGEQPGGSRIAANGVLAYMRDPRYAAEVEERSREGYERYRSLPTRKRRKAFVLLEHDSENSFGAPLRGFSICDFSYLGESERFGPHDLIHAGPVSRKLAEEAKVSFSRDSARDDEPN